MYIEGLYDHLLFSLFYFRLDMNSVNWSRLCGFIAQLVEHRTDIAEVKGLIPLKPWFFQASSFQLLKLENLLRWSFFTFIYNRISNMNYFIYTLQLLFSLSIQYKSLQTCFNKMLLSWWLVHFCREFFWKTIKPDLAWIDWEHETQSKNYG